MNQWGRLAIAVALTTPCWSSSPAAADGQPVLGFGVGGVMIDASLFGGRQVRPGQVVQLPGGAFVVSGLVQEVGQLTAQQFLARYTSTGRPDTAFGNGGVIFPNTIVRGLAPTPDGRVMVSSYSPAGGLARLEANGVMTPIAAQLYPGQIIVRPDGAIYALGDSQRGTHVASLVEPDGTIGTSFDPNVAALLPVGSRMGASNVAYSTPNGTLLSDGRLVVAFAYSTPVPVEVRCGIVALLDDGTPDATFGINGIVSMPQSVCRVDHFIDDTIRVSGDFGDAVMSISTDGASVVNTPPPFVAVDLAVAGSGALYKQLDDRIVGLDTTGSVDLTFGVSGVVTLPGMTIDGFALLDGGDIVAWGNPDGNPSALALGLIDASPGTAPQPPQIEATKFVPVAPKRIMDTRQGLGAPLGTLGVGGHVDLQIADAVGVPAAQVSAVVLNVTATDAARAGYVSVYPSGTRRPTVSNLNLDAVGQTVAGLVTVKVGANGNVTLFTSGGTHLVADIAGYYTPSGASTDGRLQTATPQRILDTRDGLGAARAKLAAGGQIDLQVLGAGPVPAAGVSAVLLNLTADQAVASGFVTAWPTGAPRPVVSNLNLVAGETRANLVVVPIGVDGKVSLFTMGGADLIADVAGWFTDSTAASDTAGLFVPITPVRMLDTRHEASPPTAPASALARLIGSTTVVPPNAAAAVAANITVTESAGSGFVTAWPAHTARPLVSNVNTVRAGQTVPNAAIVPLGLDALALYTQSGAHLILDIAGWYTAR